MYLKLPNDVKIRFLFDNQLLYLPHIIYLEIKYDVIKIFGCKKRTTLFYLSYICQRARMLNGVGTRLIQCHAVKLTLIWQCMPAGIG